MAKNSDFYAGIISALAVVELHHADTIHAEIVGLCDLGELLQHARANGEIEFAGLERYEAQQNAHLTCATCRSTNSFEYDEELGGDVCVRCGTRR